MLTRRNSAEVRADRRDQGFTLIELIISLLLLTVVILGTAYTSSRLSRNAAESEMKAAALQAVESRLSTIQIDSRYSDLETLYEGSESSIDGVTYDFTRETSIDRVTTPGAGGRTQDFKRIVVSVSGSFLGAPIVREVVVAAP